MYSSNNANKQGKRKMNDEAIAPHERKQPEYNLDAIHDEAWMINIAIIISELMGEELGDDYPDNIHEIQAQLFYIFNQHTYRPLYSVYDNFAHSFYDLLNIYDKTVDGIPYIDFYNVI